MFNKKTFLIMNPSTILKYLGKSLRTGKDTLYFKENRWFCKYYKNIEKGDTIIKRKGELLFNIHKKNAVLTFNWECEGKVYK